jgi:AcrR family transcriptional regulator
MRLNKNQKEVVALSAFLGSDTRSRILDSAIRLFADQGFDTVSVRDIAVDASVNPAAIGYHFGSKEGLIREALALVLAPLNRARVLSLEACKVRRGRKSLQVKDVVRALVAPAALSLRSDAGYERYYARFTVLAYAFRRQFIDEALSKEHDQFAKAFIDTLSKALPNVSRERLCWCYSFAIGATVHVLLDSSRGYRLKGLSGGLCDTDDSERITAHLVSFIVAGLKASQLPTRRRSPV